MFFKDIKQQLQNWNFSGIFKKETYILIKLKSSKGILILVAVFVIIFTIFDYISSNAPYHISLLYMGSMLVMSLVSSHYESKLKKERDEKTIDPLRAIMGMVMFLSIIFGILSAINTFMNSDFYLYDL